jgi:hypothetical protein
LLLIDLEGLAINLIKLSALLLNQYVELINEISLLLDDLTESFDNFLFTHALLLFIGTNKLKVIALSHVASVSILLR